MILTFCPFRPKSGSIVKGHSIADDFDGLLHCTGLKPGVIVVRPQWGHSVDQAHKFYQSATLQGFPVRMSFQWE
jgi:hypothetical protein